MNDKRQPVQMQMPSDPLDGLEIQEVYSRMDTPGGVAHWHRSAYEFHELEGGHMLISPSRDNAIDPRAHVLLSSGSWIAFLKRKV